MTVPSSIPPCANIPEIPGCPHCPSIPSPPPRRQSALSDKARYHALDRPYKREGLFNLTPNRTKCVGRAYLVGAGPGDPGLITLRGWQLIQIADVVIHDALVDESLLAQLPSHVEKIDAGKRAGRHKLSQAQINELLVRKTREGKTVIRLKGGDPYLFGRGAEELTYLAKHGIEAEVVPGVTAGIAAATAAGIPITHRRFASTVTFVTGHEEPDKKQTALDYPALAKLIMAGGTVCFYMGMGRLRAITQQFKRADLSPQTPVALVQWGTLPKQRSLRSTLDCVSSDAISEGLKAPAIIVVGPAAGVDEPGLDFFTRRPLFGQRIVITRTRQQMSELRERLLELGADVLEAPTIDIVEPEDWSSIDDAIRGIQSYDWLVLTSVNGAHALAERLNQLKLDARHLAGVKVAVIGDATSRSVAERLGVRPDLVPTRFVAESLAAELIAQHDVSGQRFLLLRADIARPALVERLSQAGALVTELTIYKTKLASMLPVNVLENLRDGTVQWITFTSSSTAKNMVELLAGERDLLKGVKIASIGPITSDTLQTLTLPPTTEAATHDIPGLVAAVVAAVRE